jgi:Cytochrome C oxidase, cbb3-type, subunit III
MRVMKSNILKVTFIIALGVLFNACSPAGGENPGHEYMPDMAHSIAYEPNVYNEYSTHTYDKESVKSLKELTTPRKPVEGTVARGYAGVVNSKAEGINDVKCLVGNNSKNGIYTPANGNVPYYYANNDAERLRATKEINGNPFPITKAGLAKGKELYTIYCGICHGEKGGGNGYLVRDDGGKYPAQPANFQQDTFYNASNGRFYHAIMYGKNVMGGYTDKLSFEERWQVIHYIRSMQAAEKKLEYTDVLNSYNKNFGTPVSQLLGTKVNNTITDAMLDKHMVAPTAESHSKLKK